MWPMKKQKLEMFVASGESFGQRLCRIRKMRDMTQRELADLSGISKRALCSYECDQREAPSHNLPAIAEHLGVTVDELLGLKPIEDRPQLKVFSPSVAKVRADRPSDGTKATSDHAGFQTWR